MIKLVEETLQKQQLKQQLIASQESLFNSTKFPQVYI